MTAAVIEDDQAEAPAPELSPREQHLAEWVEAQAAADKALRQVIAGELAEDLPMLEEAQAKAAAALEEAYGALREPERDLAELGAEIAGAESELATWQAQLEQGDVAARVEARRWVAEWDAELSQLRQKRDYAQAELLPLRDSWAKARTALDDATGKLQGRKLNADPVLAYYGAGLKTDAYGLRFGLALPAILRDPDHPEHDAAVDYWVYLCVISGLRTEDYADRLPDDALQAKRFWDSVYENGSHPGTPTGREVAASMHGEMERSAIRLHNQSMAGVDADGNRLPPRPPRPAAPVRDYMQVPWGTGNR